MVFPAMKLNLTFRSSGWRLMAVLLASLFLAGAAGHETTHSTHPGRTNLRPVIGVSG